MKMPHTRRAARRSLMFEQDPATGRMLVGAAWIPNRIIADNKQQAEDAALHYWATGRFER